MTKLWNATGFAAFHLADYNPGKEITLLPVDKWIIERCRQTVSEAVGYLEHYEIGLARHELDEFFWKDFCDYYLEIVKERLYQPEKHGYNERLSAQSALYFSMLNILKLYAVYVPHMTEYLYQEFFRQKEGCISIHRLCWEEVNRIDDVIIAFGEKLKGTISEMRKYKSENSLSMKTEMAKVTIECDRDFKEMFRLTKEDIMACCNAREVEIITC